MRKRIGSSSKFKRLAIPANIVTLTRDGALLAVSGDCYIRYHRCIVVMIDMDTQQRQSVLCEQFPNNSKPIMRITLYLPYFFNLLIHQEYIIIDSFASLTSGRSAQRSPSTSSDGPFQNTFLKYHFLYFRILKPSAIISQLLLSQIVFSFLIDLNT